MKAPHNAKCHGHRTTGYWKGYRCGARPVVKVNGHWWCRNHMPLQDSPAHNEPLQGYAYPGGTVEYLMDVGIYGSR